MAAIQKESKYPLDVIKNFKNMEQYQICRDAGLVPKMVNGKTAPVRKIDLDFVDEFGRTNPDRMKQGLSALDPNGSTYELHHMKKEKNPEKLQNLYVVEQLHMDDIVIWQNTEGKIYRTAEGKDPVYIADSFVSYLKKTEECL